MIVANRFHTAAVGVTGTGSVLKTPAKLHVEGTTWVQGATAAAATATAVAVILEAWAIAQVAMELAVAELEAKELGPAELEVKELDPAREAPVAAVNLVDPAKGVRAAVDRAVAIVTRYQVPASCTKTSVCSALVLKINTKSATSSTELHVRSFTIKDAEGTTTASGLIATVWRNVAATRMINATSRRGPGWVNSLVRNTGTTQRP